ncbi:ABC transporter permease subunit [Gordonia pseudamarae]|uniref:ABC transporter permease subunit n=1 Tax=Gordonia pseudamarae TaxID=2831662 RepID=A0ABX6INV9_9ACTN|nr:MULTISPECIES: iron ABC transporter permease [Gordonia]MBD0023027.1 iron ABC transporter permease [Gordonia sp. (in: high G+C Gram-positive bacteria)]QHN28756.1 ABC transporter permease subunit [Gordonia pseudamarae]QHN37632.1 ABC transporter permease subunit [Gordonia pseudamarae]
MSRVPLPRLSGRWVPALITLVPALFVAVFFGWPVLALVHRAVITSDGAGIGELLGNADAFELLAITLGQALASTILVAVVSIPVVWLVARVDLPGSSLLMMVVTVPFVLPTVVVGIVFRAVFTGPLAGLGIESGFWAVLIAHVFLNVAVFVRVVGAALRSQATRAAEAARCLGATPVRAFVTVLLPPLLPAIGAAASLVFLFCSTSFGVVIILGDGRLRTLETEIYQQAISYFRIPEAVALSLLQIVVVIAALLLTRIFTDPSASGAAGGPAHRRRPHGLGWVPVAAAVVYTVVLLVGPLLVLAIRSVRPAADGGWTLRGYRALADGVNGISPLDTVGYSLTTAASATLIATVVGTLGALALHRASGAVAVVGNVLAMIPLGVSAVTLGFGYLIALSELPARVAASPLVIPCVQALIAVPFVIRVLLPALASVPPRLRQAAVVCGASPWRVFITIDLPTIGRSLGAAGGFAFVMALGEFGATGFLAQPDTTTLPVLIGSALSRPGADNLATAMASAMLLVVVTAIAVGVIELFGPRPHRSRTGQSDRPGIRAVI